MNHLAVARAALAEVAPSPTAATAATPAQESELRALLARIAAGWSDVDKAEALAVALADPEAALTSFKALVADMEPAPPVRHYPAGPYTSAPLAERDPADDRRTCRDCAHLSGTGRCLSAARGNPPVGTVRTYHPIDDLLRRCEVYAPGPDDPDRRSGAERWPGMVEDAARVRALATEARNG